MHIFLMTRGINHAVDLWKTYMQSQMWDWLRYPILKDAQGNFIKNPDGSYQHSTIPQAFKVQGALRPIQLWEYVLPEKSARIVDGKIVETDNISEFFAMMNEMQPDKTRPEMAVPAWVLRKLLNAKPIPDLKIAGKNPYEITPKFVASNGTGVATYAIGFRPDKYGHLIVGNDGAYQELL